MEGGDTTTTKEKKQVLFSPVAQNYFMFVSLSTFYLLVLWLIAFFSEWNLAVKMSFSK